jgi:hypothetical protein
MKPGRQPRRSSLAAKGFVELEGGELLGALGAGGSVVELTRGDGAKLVVRLPGGQALEVAALSETFFARRR